MSQRTPRMASNHQKLGEKHGTNSSSEPSVGTNPAENLVCNYRATREYISAVLSHQFAVLCYGSPRDADASQEKPCLFIAF